MNMFSDLSKKGFLRNRAEAGAVWQYPVEPPVFLSVWARTQWLDYKVFTVINESYNMNLSRN